MKFTLSLLITICFATTFNCYGQNGFRNVIEFSTDFGSSNDLGPGDTYNVFFDDIINVDTRSSARTRNYLLSFSRFHNNKNGIKASFGFSKYGFDITGITNLTNSQIRTTYRITYLEWGLSYVRRIPLTKDAYWLIEPGIRFHSDGNQETNAISIFSRESFSLSFYSGVETLMVSDNFYANIGLQLKLPIKKHNGDYLNQAPFYPYFIGIKFGFNIQYNLGFR